MKTSGTSKSPWPDVVARLAELPGSSPAKARRAVVDALHGLEIGLAAAENREVVRLTVLRESLACSPERMVPAKELARRLDVAKDLVHERRRELIRTTEERAALSLKREWPRVIAQAPILQQLVESALEFAGRKNLGWKRGIEQHLERNVHQAIALTYAEIERVAAHEKRRRPAEAAQRNAENARLMKHALLEEYFLSPWPIETRHLNQQLGVKTGILHRNAVASMLEHFFLKMPSRAAT